MPNENPAEGTNQTGFQLLGEIVVLLLQMLYYNLEAIYQFFVPPREKAVNGEIVLVTGAGHGIGKEIALQYASLGCTVIAWDVNEESNLRTVHQINKRGYPKSYAYVCDVSNRVMVNETIEKVKKDVGDITIVINNAGIMPTHSLLDHTPEEIEKIINVNLLGHFWILKATLPSMIKNNHGHIVSISSCAGIVGLENLVPYCASKFAVRGYMEALSHELRLYNRKSEIKFTTVYPYMVDTGLCKKPIMRFPGTMDLIPPEIVARKTIEAQRRDLSEITIPEFYWYLNNYLRLFSAQSSLKLKEFLGVRLESDL